MEKHREAFLTMLEQETGEQLVPEMPHVVPEMLPMQQNTALHLVVTLTTSSRVGKRVQVVTEHHPAEKRCRKKKNKKIYQNHTSMMSLLATQRPNVSRK